MMGSAARLFTLAPGLRYVAAARARAIFVEITYIDIERTGARRGDDRITLLQGLSAARIQLVCVGRNQATVERYVADPWAHGGKPENFVAAWRDLKRADIACAGAHLLRAASTYNQVHGIQLANAVIEGVHRSEIHHEFQATDIDCESS